MSPFAPKTRINIGITRQSRTFEGQAIVMYSVAGMGMGLRFEATDSRQLSTLKKWLCELSGESAPEAEIEQTPLPVPQAVDTKHILNDLLRELLRKGVLTEDAANGTLERLAPRA
jgi:hypothetical protein